MPAYRFDRAVGDFRLAEKQRKTGSRTEKEENARDEGTLEMFGVVFLLLLPFCAKHEMCPFCSRVHCELLLKKKDRPTQ